MDLWAGVDYKIKNNYKIKTNKPILKTSVKYNHTEARTASILYFNMPLNEEENG